MKINRFIPIFATLLLLLILIIVTPLFAEADECTNNFGFRKNVPNELKQKFPLCDLFLDIIWIDPTGKFNVEYYSSDNLELKQKKMDITWRIGKLQISDYNRQKKKMDTIYLLFLQEIPKEGKLPWLAELEIFKINKKDYYSKEFENLLKGAIFEYSSAKPFFDKITIRKGETNKILDKSFGSDTNYGCLFNKTACLTSPDEQYADFYLMKKPFRKNDLQTPYGMADLSAELKKKYDVILNFAHDKCLELARERREKQKYPNYTNIESDCLNTVSAVRDSTIVLDINNDGRNAYFFGVAYLSRNQFIYFSPEGDYQFREVDSDCGCGYYLNEKKYNLEKCKVK
jgi:hypothetical protein